MDDVVLRTLTAVWGWVCSLTPAHWMMMLTGVVVVLTVAVVVYAARTLKAANKSLAVSRESLAVFVKPRVGIYIEKAICRPIPDVDHHGFDVRIILTNYSPLPITVQDQRSVECRVVSPPIEKDQLKLENSRKSGPDGGLYDTKYPIKLKVGEHARFRFCQNVKLPDEAAEPSVEGCVKFSYRGEDYSKKAARGCARST